MACSRQPASTVAAIAGAVWVATAGVGWLIVRLLDVNPMRMSGAAMPVAVGAIGALALTGIALGTCRPWLLPVTAGAYAGWSSMTILAGLNGTPHGYGTLSGDAGRLAAFVTHYSTTWRPSDAADPDNPAEYSPLYPMLLGRIAAVTGTSGWRLLGPAQAALIGASIVVGFLLWSRLVHPATAFVLATVFVAARSDPTKSFEILALVVLVPWLLLTFTPPSDRRPLNPVVAGVIGGLCVTWYPAPLMSAVFGVAALMAYGYWRTPERARYVRHAAVTVGVALIAASWYLGPLAWAYLTETTEVVNNSYPAIAFVEDPLVLAPFEGDLFAVVRILGVVGTVLLLSRAWWAPPMALLILGTQIFQVLNYLHLANSGHAFVLYYSGWVMTYLTTVAGILVAERCLRAVVRLGSTIGPAECRRAAVVFVALFVGAVGIRSWEEWTPAPLGIADRYFTAAELATDANYSPGRNAHRDRLPNGEPVRYPAPDLAPPFNATAVGEAVRSSRPSPRAPTVLSYDQRIFVFEAWPNWLPPGEYISSSLHQYNSRYAALVALAGTTDPRQFAAASATTAWGPIDVFCLKKSASGYSWKDVTFSPAQFSDGSFTVTNVDEETVVIVRRA